MKRQIAIAIGLLLLIPVIFRLEGLLFSLINPENAAGHPNYARNYHFLSLVQRVSFLAMLLAVATLWFLSCFMVIRSKQQSLPLLFLGALGPFGFAILAMLRDRAPAESDRHERFVRHLNRFVRFGYFLCVFVIIWMLAEKAMIFKRDIMIRHQAAVTGMLVAQIVDQQNASSGMWAFAEGNEVMYFVVLFYLLWPVAFNLVARVAATMTPPKPRELKSST